MHHYLSSLKERTKRFSLSWFTLIMAGGVIPLLFTHFLLGTTLTPVKVLATFFWITNCTLFLLFCGLFAMRVGCHKGSLSELVDTPHELLFAGAFSMAFSTTITGSISVFHNSWGWGGRRFVYVVWGFWWLDVVLAFLINFWVTHLMITRIDYTKQKAPIFWMFPVASLTVASTCSGTLAAALLPISPHHAWLTTVFSVIMMAIGLTVGMNFITMHVETSILSGLIPGPPVVSNFFPLAILCQCAYIFLLLAGLFRAQLPLRWGTSEILGAESTGEMFYTICFAAGFVLWSMSTGWLVSAVMAVAYVAMKGKFGFSPSYWSLIFPNGVYANLSIQLGNMTDSNVFRIWGAIYAWIRVELGYFRRTSPSLDLEKGTEKALDQGSEETETETETEAKIQAGEGEEPPALTNFK